jgi:hypothetical protein
MIAMLVESFSLDLAWTLAATVCSVLSVRDQMAGLAQNIITNSGPFIRVNKEDLIFIWRECYLSPFRLFL